MQIPRPGPAGRGTEKEETMYPRTEYEMTEKDLEMLLQCSRPSPCIIVGGRLPSSPQDRANRAWAELGKKIGFDSLTVRPINGKGQRFFTAVPLETEDQKNERMAKEKEKERLEKIAKLKKEFAAMKEELGRLEQQKPN